MDILKLPGIVGCCRGFAAFMWLPSSAIFVLTCKRALSPLYLTRFAKPRHHVPLLILRHYDFVVLPISKRLVRLYPLEAQEPHSILQLLHRCLSVDGATTPASVEGLVPLLATWLKRSKLLQSSSQAMMCLQRPQVSLKVDVHCSTKGVHSWTIFFLPPFARKLIKNQSSEMPRICT